jgi:hypothetical protein
VYVARAARLVLPVALLKVAAAPEYCRLIALIRAKRRGMSNELKSDQKAIALC